MITMEPLQNNHTPLSQVPSPQPQAGAWSMATVTQQPPSQPIPPPAGQQSPSVLLREAGNKDLIEREWVDAVKKALHDDSDDPYALSRVITGLKIQYMKQRYNKDIKTSD